LKNIFLFESRVKLDCPFSGKFRPKKPQTTYEIPLSRDFLKGNNYKTIKNVSLQGFQKETSLGEFNLLYP